MATASATPVTHVDKPAGEKKIVVAQVIADAPADGVLHVDDEILEVEGEPMTDAETVRSRLQEVTAGESASMTLVRDGEEVTIDVPTVRDEESGRTIVGVYLAPRYDMPYDVTISAGNVGGPHGRPVPDLLPAPPWSSFAAGKVRES